MSEPGRRLHDGPLESIDDFDAYELCRRNGQTIMAAVKRVVSITGLAEAQVKNILGNYGEHRNKYHRLMADLDADTEN